MDAYTTNFWIDEIQKSKKTWVNTWVKDENLSKPINEFIEIQTKFTKDMVKHFHTFADLYAEAFSKVTK